MDIKTRGRALLDFLGDILTLRDLFQIAMGGSLVGVWGTVFDWWSGQPTLGKFILGTALGLMGFALGGELWSRAWGKEGNTESESTSATDTQERHESQSRLCGPRDLPPGYPQNLKVAVPIVSRDLVVELDGKPPYLEFSFTIYNASLYPITLDEALVGTVRIRFGSSTPPEPLLEPPRLVAGAAHEIRYAAKRLIRIRQPLRTEEVEKIVEIKYERGEVVFILGGLVRMRSDDPIREGDHELHLGEVRWA